MNSYICPVCKGVGLLSFICNTEEENDAEFIPIYDFEPCNVCSGLGYIEEGGTVNEKVQFKCCQPNR